MSTTFRFHLETQSNINRRHEHEKKYVTSFVVSVYLAHRNY